LLKDFALGFRQTLLSSRVAAIVIAQDVGVRGSEDPDVGKDSGRENECCKESYHGKDAHGVEYGADLCDRQGNIGA
jgi:hypothetical protein